MHELLNLQRVLNCSVAIFCVNINKELFSQKQVMLFVNITLLCRVTEITL